MRIVEETIMPSVITLYACGVWFCVGFFVGLGWALGARLIAKF